MITTAHAKKETGLGDLFKGYVPQQLEEQKKVSDNAYANTTLQRTFEQYNNFIAYAPYDWLDKGKHDVRKWQVLPKEVLTPEEINQFLQLTIAYETNPEYSIATGMFVTELIKKSYKAGHHDFVLDMHNLPEIDKLACNLYGMKDCVWAEPLNMAVYGDVGHNFGDFATNLNVTIHGNARDKVCCSSRSCVVTVHGLALNVGVWSEGILMKTSNEKTLMNMLLAYSGLQSDPHACPRGVVFIHPDGTQEHYPQCQR